MKKLCACPRCSPDCTVRPQSSECAATSARLDEFYASPEGAAALEAESRAEGAWLRYAEYDPEALDELEGRFPGF